MYYVYVLKSRKTNKLYFGSTSDLRRRLHQHNSGLSLATKSGQPWEVLYYEAYAAKSSALKRERRLKHYGQAWRRLKERIQAAE